MESSSRTGVWIGIAVVVVALAAFALYLSTNTASAPGATSTTTPAGGTPEPSDNGLVTLALGQAGSVGGITITPTRVIEDSRCPQDVQCIQAGRVRIKAIVDSGIGVSATAEQDLLLGEPLTTESDAVTLVEVSPASVSTKKIEPSEYRFTFKVEKKGEIAYQNATPDVIRVTTPTPGAVVGKSFTVKGEARGAWYFEASFPVRVLDMDGKELAVAPAQAEGDWMTTDFVPFSATLTIPDSYTGPATLVLEKDNPSGLPQNAASASFRITIEY